MSALSHFKFSGNKEAKHDAVKKKLMLFKVSDAFDSFRTIRVPAKDGMSGHNMQLQYTHQKVIGNGSFGVVYHIKLSHNSEDAAIKKVLQDKRFKVSEIITYRHIY